MQKSTPLDAAHWVPNCGPTAVGTWEPDPWGNWATRGNGLFGIDSRRLYATVSGSVYDMVVVALVYRIEHRDSVDYRSAQSLDCEGPGFRVRIEEEVLRFEFKDQYGSEQAAREAIKDYIREWEFKAGLQHGPDSFRLKFLSSESKYLNAPPGTLGPLTIRSGAPRVIVRLRVGLPRYPQPPSGIKLTPDVMIMYDRYMAYRRGREPLQSMAYFCWTVIEHSIRKQSGKRREAAKMYEVSQGVLNEIAKLSSERGGPDARKAVGRIDPLTTKECRFLEQAVKVLIRRAAQKAYNPEGELPKIKKSDLHSAVPLHTTKEHSVNPVGFDSAVVHGKEP